MRNIVKKSIYHLKVETGWSYQYHLWHSIKNSSILIKIAFKSIIHGLLPFMWKNDAPKEVIKLYHEIMKIQHVKKIDKLRKLSKKERYK